MTEFSSLLVVGNFEGSHVGGSILRAAVKMGLVARAIDVGPAQSNYRLVNSLAWRAFNKRAPYGHRVRSAVGKELADGRPAVVITTGISPVEKRTIDLCHAQGSICIHYSTDDPWNPGQRAGWHFDALKAYDVVFTPRRSNLEDLQALPCRSVRYLPFGYDPDFLDPESETEKTHTRPQVLFVGGADADRIDFFERYLDAGAPVALVGGYWGRHPRLRPLALGHKTPSELATLTRAADVNLCLVRRANRDGHVMRSFEIAALGGCMLVEETAEHRQIFGGDGECVGYFSSPEQAAERALHLLADADERRRLSQAVRQRILAGGNTYADRLRRMLADANASIAQQELGPQ